MLTNRALNINKLLTIIVNRDNAMAVKPSATTDFCITEKSLQVQNLNL
jgi:hypothetical protein